ncbi:MULTISPECIES: hypothetical protein [unclassified Enterococcus]|jgi:hypothetical protein|uniref:hypothetical protein n=1 Tax=unclassified Enterococcus TaxID=2608891 RepID=UPI003D29FAB1
MDGKKLMDPIQKNWSIFLDDFSERPKKYFVRLFLFLIVVLLFTSTMFIIPARIKNQQLHSLVYSRIDSEKLNPIDYGAVDRQINDRKAISVMFSVPHGELYQEVQQLLSDPEKSREMNRQIYFYPLVYDSENLESKYKIAKNQVTFLFFDDGKEKNRVEISKEDIPNLEKELIPELNRLPMWNLRQLEQELNQQNETEENAAAQAETTPQ